LASFAAEGEAAGFDTRRSWPGSGSAWLRALTVASSVRPERIGRQWRDHDLAFMADPENELRERDANELEGERIIDKVVREHNT
jgi:hypothetical protein